MAAQRKDLYDSLKDDVQKLRDLGKSWGLDDADIDACFQRALESDKSPTKSRKRRVCRCFGLSICGVAVFVVVFFLFFGLLNAHKPSKLFVTRYTQDVIYPIMRAVRLASLPLRQVFDLSSLHELDCIVPNPFFSGYGDIDCWPCEHVKEVRALRKLSNFTRFYYHSGIPVLVKDANLTQVTFDDLKSAYLDNVQLLSYSAHKVQSNNPFIRSIGDLFTADRTVDHLLETDLYLQWRVLKAGGVRLIRSLSPKPYFVPPKAEIATEMFVLIHTPAAEAHPLPWSEHPNTWLTQAYGSQEVTLTPVEACKGNCTEVSIVLQPSDVLYYAPRFWQLSAFSLGDKVSIAFMGSFF